MIAEPSALSPVNFPPWTAHTQESAESDYLLPAQRAALYEFLATTPGLTLERNVNDISGRPGIGVGWSFMGSKAMLIFDPGTYTLLGETPWGEQGQVGGSALLQMAITNQAGQVP
jgi:hypothetical protein